MKVYYIKDEYGDYICPGSFVCQDAPKKVIEKKKNKKKYKKRQ